VHERPRPAARQLHGIGTGPEAWAPQVDALSSTRRVLTPRVPLDLGRAVEELQAVDAARFDLCGLSWGALVALRFASKSRRASAGSPCARASRRYRVHCVRCSTPCR